MKRPSKGTLRLLAFFGVGFVLSVFAGIAWALQNEISVSAILGFPVLILCSQGCFWGIALPLAGKTPPWHLVAAVVTIVSVIYCVQWIEVEDNTIIATLLAIVLMQMLCACIPAFVLRAIGFRLTTDTNDTQPLIQGILLAQGAIAPKPAGEEKRRFQFLLRTLFSWTSASAVLLSAYSVLTLSPVWPEIVSYFRDPGLPSYVVFLSVVVSPFCLWLVFSDELLRWRFLAFLLANVIALIITFFGMIIPSLMDLELLIIPLFLAEISLLLWLLLARASGFRLLRTTV